MHTQDLLDRVYRPFQQQEEIHVAPLPGGTPGVGAVEEEIPEAGAIELLRGPLSNSRTTSRIFGGKAFMAPPFYRGTPLPGTGGIYCALQIP